MKRIISVFLLVLTSMSAHAGDFRSSDWGMSPSEVRATEPGVEWLELGGNNIAFQSSVNSLDATVGYVFTNGVLSRGAYIFNESHSNRTEYISDYNGLAALLDKKYGEPVKTQVVWLDDLYKDDPSDWGMAIATGDLKYYKRWETETTKIQMSLLGIITK